MYISNIIAVLVEGTGAFNICKKLIMLIFSLFNYDISTPLLK